MDRDREKQATEAKLARCRELAEEFRDGSIAQMIRDMEDELLQQIQELESQKAASVGGLFHTDDAR